jgi:hypothetical protein
MADDQKPRRGRPPKDPELKKAASLSFRVRGPYREKLAQAALANERSLSEEAEHRLEQSFELETIFGTGKKQSLLLFLSSAISMVEAIHGASVFEEEAAAVACRSALIGLIESFVQSKDPDSILGFNDRMRSQLPEHTATEILSQLKKHQQRTGEELAQALTRSIELAQGADPVALVTVFEASLDELRTMRKEGLAEIAGEERLRRMRAKGEARARQIVARNEGS